MNSAELAMMVKTGKLARPLHHPTRLASEVAAPVKSAPARAFPAHAFHYEGRENHDSAGWDDHAFTDTSPKGKRRLWVLSIPNPFDAHSDDSPYAMLRRSETDDGEFNDAATLPAAMVAGFLAIVAAATQAPAVATIHTVAEDIRARLNQIEDENYAPDDSHTATGDGPRSLNDERFALRRLEELIDKLGY